ncbi:peptidoglycan editing factor PgeF [Paraferrimonas sedimenticola]|uniref:Purine nucleoside phosphorylase n=1 Tax=Paraferrimonas sedimenticola TaxID=375674 RepID=A0AA37RZ12_9GAMM|nr:peptidoglycan editing factor PgeF [Paraferrimonas sedimenticola]GLP97132.1 laccase domain protein [Paraferrimonas sedimenticola]
MRLLQPDWPAPDNVKAIATTRIGGHSLAPFDGANLGMHVHDDPQAVQANRNALVEAANLPQAPLWLEQVHGVEVVAHPEQLPLAPPVADAAFTKTKGQVCAVMTADCLPVLFCDAQGQQVAAAHAGWRGLAAGVLEQTLAKFEHIPQVMAWIGPAISADAFEVGVEVRETFIAADSNADKAFRQSHKPGKYLADLSLLAEQRLRSAGVSQIVQSRLCTFNDHQQFYSYRRDGQTGRQACLIWLD